MNRLTSGTVSLLALLFVVSCNTEPTDDLRNGIDKLVASPSQLFLELGKSKTVEVGAVDGQGNPLSFAYEVTSIGNGITVRRDSTFLQIFIDDSTLAAPATGPRFRFIVTATARVGTSFTVSAGGKDIVIPVQVIALNSIEATFSTLAPALGDTVTLTVPAGTSFSQTAELTVTGAPLEPLIVERDPAGAFVRFIPPPNITGPITISEVIPAAAPTLRLKLTTTDRIVTPQVDSLDVIISNATPNVGDVVSVTLPALLKFQPTTIITFPDQLAPGANFTVAADSNSLTFEAPPNATGAGTVDSVVFPGSFVVSLPTRPTITAENIGTTLAAVFNTTTPAINQTVILTAPAGFSFDPAATLTIQDAAPFISSQSGTEFDFVPSPGQSGTPTITGVILNSAPQFNLTMPTADALTVPTAVPSLGGTADSATAPPLTLPGAGASNIFFDAGTFPGDFFEAGFPEDLIYKLTIPAGGVTLTLDWANDSDVDIILCDDGCANFVDIAGATGAQPEVTSFDGIPAGTYYLVIELFAGPPPAWVSLTLTEP